MTAQALKLHDQVVVGLVGLFGNDLCAGGAVFVHDFGYTVLPVFGHVEGEGHVGCRVVGLEEVLGDAVEHAGAEGAPAFAVFDLFVDAVSDAWVAWVAKDAAVAECAWAKFHAALEPGEGVACGEDLGAGDGWVFEDFPAWFFGVVFAGFDAVFAAIGWPEVGVFLRLDGVAGEVGGVGGCADGGAGVAGCGLYKEFFDVGQCHEALV